MKILTIEYANGDTKIYDDAEVKAVPYDAVYFEFVCGQKDYYVNIHNINAIIIEDSH